MWFEERSWSMNQMKMSSLIVEEWRDIWSFKIEFMLVGLAYLFATTNFLNLPRLVLENGGFAFLAAYGTALLFVILPILILELSVGQLTGRAPIQALYNICPVFKGVGVSQIVFSLFVMAYMTRYMAWLFLYLFHLFWTIIDDRPAKLIMSACNLKAEVPVEPLGAKGKPDWDDDNLSKLTLVRIALRQRENIKSLVSKFESLAENPEEEAINLSPKNASPFVKISPRNLTLRKQVSIEDEKEYSIASHSSMRSSSSKAIDQMFDFVEKADMLTPNSSIAMHSCNSTPCRPMATSTPFVVSQLKSRSFPDVSERELIYREKTKTFLKEIESLKYQISRAVEKITICQKKHDVNGTLLNLSAQRTLLVANERRLLLTEEMNNLKEVYMMKHTNDSNRLKSFDNNSLGTYTLDISLISIRLNRTFYIKSSGDDSSFVFVVIVKCAGQIYATQLLDVMDMGTLRASTVQVRESIRFDRLPADFTTSIEVFAIKTGRCQVSHASTALKIANKAKAFLFGKSKTSDSDQESQASFTSDFFHCGILHLNRESVCKHHFLLSDSQYPLDGSIELRTTCLFDRKNLISSIEHL